MSTLVIHGAGGFVAAHLIPKIAASGRWDELVLVDREPVDLSEIGAPIAIRTSAFVSESLSTLSIPTADAVIVLAGTSDVDDALERPVIAIRNNVNIALDAADWVLRHPQNVKLVYVSSDEVLGESESPLPPDELLRPTQPYAASKAAAEIILRGYESAYGVDLLILRSCNLAGPYQKPVKLIPVTVLSLMRGEPIPLYGDGKHRREWMAVEDLCDALLLVLEKGKLGEIFQATTGISLTTLEVIEIVSGALGIPATFRHDRDRLVNDRSYAMDAASVRSLGWTPTVDPRDAIARAAVTLRSEFGG